jgi:hypothetical protein
MTRNGTLAGAFALLFLGYVMFPVAVTGNYARLGGNWMMWVVFGTGMGILGMVDKVLFLGTSSGPRLLGSRLFGSRLALAGLGPFSRFRGFGSQRQQKNRQGWFSHVWGFLGVAIGGLLFLGIQSGTAPAFFDDKGMAQLWPLILLYLGVGQLIGFGIDVIRRVTGILL